MYLIQWGEVIGKRTTESETVNIGTLAATKRRTCSGVSITVASGTSAEDHRCSPISSNNAFTPETGIDAAAKGIRCA